MMLDIENKIVVIP